MVLTVKIETDGILKQMEVVKAAGDKYEDEMLKLRSMLARGTATEEKTGKAEE